MVHVLDPELGKLADHDQRDFRGGHEPVLGVAIDEHIHLVLGRDVARDVAAGQENFAQVPTIEVEAGSRGSHDGEGVALADDCHARAA